MSRRFNAAFFRRNRESLRSLFTGTAPIVLTANGVLQRSADTTYPFHQDRNFWYLTGIDEPDVILVIDKTKEYLILPQREHYQDVFNGSIEAEHFTALSGIETVLPNRDGWKQLENRLKKVKHVATLAPPPAYVDVHGFYTNPTRAQLVDRMRTINPDIELLDLRQHLATLRMVKQPSELAAIQDAISITQRSIHAILRRAWEPSTTELLFNYELGYRFRKYGAQCEAFDSVIAAGANSCVIHHMPGTSPIGKQGSLLLDVGAQVDGYAADITRTYTIGKVTKRFRQVYDAVLDVQTHAMELLRPGAIIKEYEHDVERYMGEKLRELGLIKSIDKESVRQYFPHATSHHLGLDTHDVANYDRPLSANMVLTVEPGIYIPEEGIGIRIEDDVLITEEGTVLLTDGLSRELSSLTIK